jgi:hypothetical protein
VRYFRTTTKPGHYSPGEALQLALDQAIADGTDPGEALVQFLGRTIEALLDNGYLGTDRAAQIFGPTWTPIPQNRSDPK